MAPRLVEECLHDAGNKAVADTCLAALQEALGDIDYVDEAIVERVKRAIEGIEDSVVADLHVWSIGPGIHAAIVSLVTHHPQPLAVYKAAIPAELNVVHVTVEVDAVGAVEVLDTLVGLETIAGTVVPVPLRLKEVAPLPLCVSVTVPARAPLVLGVKATLMTQDCPTARGAPQLLD